MLDNEIIANQYSDFLRRVLGEAGIDDPKTIKFIVESIAHEIASMTLTISVVAPECIVGDLEEPKLKEHLRNKALEAIGKIIKDNAGYLYKKIEHPKHGPALYLAITLFKI